MHLLRELGWFVGLAWRPWQTSATTVQVGGARAQGSPRRCARNCTHLSNWGAPVGLDDFWQACGTGVNGSFHDQDGHPLVNTKHFPDLKAMVAHATQLNLYADFYSNNCGKNPRCLSFCGQTFIIAYFFIQFQVVTSSSPSPTQHSSKWRSRNRWISWWKPIFRELSWMAV